jgi:TatD DNase family protein
MPLVNFHTHSQSKNTSNLIAVQSLEVGERDMLKPGGLYTIGLHPWSTVGVELNSQIELVESLITDNSIIGLGEIGLDKLRGASLEIQKKYLETQVELAYSINKPIIVHCVKAWDELLEIKRAYSNEIPWAIHGFNGSEQQVKQLIDEGFYLSIGVALKNSNSKITSAINKIPVNRLFLETDDSDANIEDIYRIAAEHLSISINVLEIQLYNNFLEFFAKNYSS